MPTPRRSVQRAIVHRAIALAVIAAAAGVACNDAERRAGGTVCAACALVAATEAEILADDHEARASCGTCPDGMACNTNYDPPRCARSPGREGDLCGDVIATSFTCELGFTCRDGACAPLPGLDAPCDFRSDEAVTLTHLHPTYCGPGLLCGTDERCHPGCTEDCATPTRCNPLLDPPACTVDVAMNGEPCGRVHSMWSIDCLPLHACVDRGSGPRCEPAGDGPQCEYERCPAGLVCDASRRVCVPPP